MGIIGVESGSAREGGLGVGGNLAGDGVRGRRRQSWRGSRRWERTKVERVGKPNEPRVRTGDHSSSRSPDSLVELAQAHRVSKLDTILQPWDIASDTEGLRREEDLDVASPKAFEKPAPMSSRLVTGKRFDVAA